METGRTIYYEGNTVIPPAPGKKSLHRRRAASQGTIIDADTSQLMQVVPKVCATNQCVWCGAPFGHFAVRCRSCGCCQYCGKLTDSFEGCRYCGNELNDELRAAQASPEPPQKEKRSVRRLGPRTPAHAPRRLI